MTSSQAEKLGFGADELVVYLAQKGWTKDAVLDGVLLSGIGSMMIFRRSVFPPAICVTTMHGC